MQLGSDSVASLMIGEMGIKTAAVGSETVYTRPGGYIYIILENEKEN